MMEIYIARK